MDTAIRILNSTRKIPISHCLYPINLRSLSRTVTSMENRLLDFQICLEEGLFFKDSEILSRAEEAANEGWRSASQDRHWRLPREISVWLSQRDSLITL